MMKKLLLILAILCVPIAAIAQPPPAPIETMYIYVDGNIGGIETMPNHPLKISNAGIAEPVDSDLVLFYPLFILAAVFLLVARLVWPWKSKE